MEFRVIDPSGADEPVPVPASTPLPTIDAPPATDVVHAAGPKDT